MALSKNNATATKTSIFDADGAAVDRQPFSANSAARSGNCLTADDENAARGGSDPKSNSLTRRQKLTIFAMAITNFSAYLAFSIIAPFFPQEATAKGASDTVIGFIFGGFQLVIFVTSPIYGSIVTEVGAKFMYMAGSFMCSICIVLFGFLDGCPDGITYIVMCFLVRMVDANGTAMLLTATSSILAHQFPQRLSFVMGIQESCVGIGLMIGPVIGGSLYSAGGFQLPFMVVGAVLMASCIASYFLVPSVDGLSQDKKFTSLLKIPDVFLAFFLIFSTMFALGFLEPNLSKHLVSLDETLSASTIGAVFLATPGVYALVTPLVGYVCDKGYVKSVIVCGCFAAVCGMLCIGPSPLLPFLPKQVWYVIVSLAILGIGIAGSFVTTFQLTLQTAIKNGYTDGLGTYGMVSGLFTSGSALGAFAGPSAGGFLAETIGFAWAATACASLSLLMALATILSLVIDKYKSKKLEVHGDIFERAPLLAPTAAQAKSQC